MERVFKITLPRRFSIIIIDWNKTCLSERWVDGCYSWVRFTSIIHCTIWHIRCGVFGPPVECVGYTRYIKVVKLIECLLQDSIIYRQTIFPTRYHLHVYRRKTDLLRLLLVVYITLCTIFRIIHPTRDLRTTEAYHIIIYLHHIFSTNIDSIWITKVHNSIKTFLLYPRIRWEKKP